MIGLTLAAGLASVVAPEATGAPAPGTVFVSLAATDGHDPAVDQPFADAVGRALGNADFTIMPEPGHSRYIAEVSIGREKKGIVPERVKTDRAHAGIGSWGPAFAVPFGSRKTQLQGLVLTTLTVTIVGRNDRQVVWHASATTTQAEGAGPSSVVADKLARVVVAAYPVTPDAPVSVP